MLSNNRIDCAAMITLYSEHPFLNSAANISFTFFNLPGLSLLYKGGDPFTVLQEVSPRIDIVQRKTEKVASVACHYAKGFYYFAIKVPDAECMSFGSSGAGDGKVELIGNGIREHFYIVFNLATIHCD